MNWYSVKVLTQFINLLILVFLTISTAPVFAQDTEVQTRDVNFKTEDGWTIYGTFYVPQRKGTDPVAALLVIGEPDTSPRRLGGNISRAIAREGMAALTIDLRGNDHSHGDKDFIIFSPEEREAMQLDVRAAVKFLASQREVDGNRIGIFAPTDTADLAAREAAENADQIKALILSTGVYTEEGLESIKFRRDMPVLAVASNDDPREVQRESAEPFFLSGAKGSRLFFLIDRGANIFNRPGHPMERVTEWLKENLVALGTQTEITLKTSDGMNLWGIVYKPDGLGPNERVPGVVFVHGANHNGTTWFPLIKEVVKAGMAAITFDQRGYRKSHKDTQLMGQDIDVDVKAAVNYLASQDFVNPNRIGLMTATSRSGWTVLAADGDDRIKTLAGISFYGVTEESDRALANTNIPVFLIASVTDANADGRSLEVSTRAAYEMSKNKDSMLLLYDIEGGRGSTMIRLNPELIGMLARWFREKLVQ